MTAYEAILNRRSIRRFTEEIISDELIEQLLRSAMAAPSACNRQPREFYVVKNPELLAELRHASRFTDMNSTLMIVVAGDAYRALSNKDNDFWIQDCAAATENILLTATELGLGSCWCGLYPTMRPVEHVRRTLNLPEHIIPLSLIQLGYPAQQPEARSVYNAERVHVFE